MHVSNAYEISNLVTWFLLNRWKLLYQVYWLMVLF